MLRHEADLHSRLLPAAKRLVQKPQHSFTLRIKGSSIGAVRLFSAFIGISAPEAVVRKKDTTEQADGDAVCILT